MTDPGQPRRGRVWTGTRKRDKPEAPARKGKVQTYIKTDRGLVPWQALRKAETKKAEAGTTKQIREEQRFMADNGLVPVPFEVQGLLILLDNCTFFDACARQIALDVVGQGYELLLEDEKATPDDAEKKRIEDFLDRVNDDDETIEDITERAVIDLITVGWLTIEIGRDEAGMINGVFHVPANTIRIHKSRKKYCQTLGTERVWFKKFGEEEDIDKTTGAALTAKPTINEDGTPGKATIDPDKRANELIFYRRYYPQSSYYGAPPILPAVGAVNALISIRDYNLAFFENYGVPAALVTLEGEWEEDSVPLVTNFIDAEIKGSQNQHKTIVLQPPEGGKVTWEPLVIEIKEGHFKLYQASLIEEVLAAHRMPPYRIGLAKTGSLGGNVASESTQIYVESTVNPLKLLTGRIIGRRIIEGGLQGEGETTPAKDFEFWWNDIDLRNLTEITDRCVKLFGVGAMNRAEIREETNLGAMEEGEDGGAYYISSTYTPIAEAGLNPSGDTAAATQATGAAMASEIGKLQKQISEAIRQMHKGGQNASDSLSD